MANYGQIQVSFEVVCGACQDGHLLGSRSKREAQSEARENGYILTRALGWLCPRCAKEDNPTHADQQEPPHA